MVRIAATFLTLGLATLISAQGTQFITGACTSDADCASGCCGFNSGKCAGPVVAQERDGGCGFGDAQPNDRAAVALTGGQPQSAAGNGAANNGAANNGASNNGAANNGAANNGAAQNSNPPAGQGNGNGAGNNGAGNNGAGNNGAGNNGAGNNGAGNNGAASNGAANNGAANNGAANGGAANAGTAGTGSQFITGACTSDADCASGCCGFNSGKCAGPVVAQERDGGCGFGDAQPNDDAAQAFQAGQKRGLLFEWE